MVQAYWHVGRLIVEEEQSGKERANYGESLIEELSKRLTTDYGKDFNRTNLRYMRQFYLMFKNHHALRDELTWTHYRFLLKVENESARDFYMIESVNSNWSTREPVIRKGILHKYPNCLSYFAKSQNITEI